MTATYRSLELFILPLRSDNYSYVVHDHATRRTLIVDPSEAGPVEAFLEAKGFTLDLILDTHHHNDHTAGNLPLQDKFGSAIIASRYDREQGRIPGSSSGVAEGETVSFGAYTIRVLDTPGHTLGHVCFVVEGANWLFCGDTMFGLGCGRLFEGTAAMLWASCLKLRSLPEDTLVFCGHEYTLANARFALHLDPDFPGLKEYVAKLERRHRSEGKTIPVLMRDEKAFNPFLLADHPRFHSLGNEPKAVFAAIRDQKDSF